MVNGNMYIGQRGLTNGKFSKQIVALENFPTQGWLWNIFQSMVGFGKFSNPRLALENFPIQGWPWKIFHANVGLLGKFSNPRMAFTMQTSLIKIDISHALFFSQFLCPITVYLYFSIVFESNETMRYMSCGVTRCHALSCGVMRCHGQCHA